MSDVAPLAGAWIEIEWAENYRVLDSVAPLAGAWIEISSKDKNMREAFGRSPRGSVD